MLTIIIAVLVTLIIAAPVSAFIAINYRKNVVEAKLGSAEEKARQVLNQNEIVLKAKEKANEIINV